jgi:hypothetical protein
MKNGKLGDHVRAFELRTGLRTFRGKPAYTPSGLTDHKDVHPAHPGSFQGAAVDHGSLAEAAGARRSRAGWCTTCRAGAHAKCTGKRAVRGFGKAPCECPKCRPGRA